MSLSTDLLTQFVKVTNDTKKNKTDTTAYGEIVIKGESTYVKLDGATDNVLTPVSDSKAYATTFQSGDRVLVTIKDHKVIITSNLTNPSLTGVDIIDLANLLQEHEVYIEDLTAKNLVVEEKIVASEGEFASLKAKDAEITGKLEAAEADIKTLKTTSLTAETAKITYATIKSLDAVNADVFNLRSTYGTFENTTTERLTAIEGMISDLEVGNAEIGSLRSEVADINTLIFGSATGDTIQTSFSNAVIAQLGNAQIKSAMIESVSASKITAGDIITNNVRVKSEDGSLLISDETMQISDGTRVRVQIGKDAANDYSINIWDQNGNLMFSKGGITDSAIKEAIIRNDMVSNTANIHASKLDIDSLFGEINGSTNTIKSTKVYLDDKKQTLDVAFTSLSSTVTDQGEIITSQGTAISTIQGQISSKIWQQDINTATNEMTTKYSTLEQNLGSFKTTVSETYATISDLDSIEIGGRNLITNSDVEKTTGNEFVQYVDLAPIFDMHGLIEYTLSFDIKSANPSTKSTVNIYCQNGTGSKHNIGVTTIPVTTEYVRHSITFTPSVSAPNLTASMLAFYGEYGSGNIPYVKNVKLEKGNKATDWTPAPEDVENDISTIGTRVSSAETSITQLSDRITANVSDTTSLGTRMSTVEQTASDLTIELSNLQIGGRNLLRGGRLIQLRSNNDSLYPISCIETIESGVQFYRIKRIDTETCPSTAMSLYSILSKTTFAYGEMTGKQVTLSFKARTSHTITGTFMCYTYGGDASVIFNKPSESFTSEWKTYSVTIDEFPDLTNRSGIHWNPLNFNIPNDVLADFYLDIRDYKFELGNKATDWTPAPEDVNNSIITASKTATDYLNFSSAGLVVGNLTATALGKNVLISSNDIRIRTGTTDNAVFGADIIELAKDNASATISMLNGAFKIYYDADNSDGGFGVYGVTSTGEERLAFQPVNENDNLTIGWGGYHAKKNCTNIYGHNMNLLAGNDLAIECDDWKINIDGNLFAKASTSSFIELIGLSSDDNVAIGHGGYSAAIGKTNIYGNKIQHIVNTSSGSATYKPYYEAGDSFETEWYGAGFISSSSKVVYFSIPLAKPVIGSSTPNVTVTNATTGTGGLQIRQDSNYVFGSTSSGKATPSSYSAKVVGNGNFVQIEATMANSTNAVNNAPCGINANIKITFS